MDNERKPYLVVLRKGKLDRSPFPICNSQDQMRVFLTRSEATIYRKTLPRYKKIVKA